jgi:hypothetical protein
VGQACRVAGQGGGSLKGGGDVISIGQHVEEIIQQMQLIAQNIKSEMRFTVISKADPVLRTLNSHNLPNQRLCMYQFNAVLSRRTPSSMICLPESSFNTKRDVMATTGIHGTS